MGFLRIKAEMVADRLIMEGAQFNTPQYEAQLREAWRYVYPGSAVPAPGAFRSALWASTRAALENTSIHHAPLSLQQAFVCERFIHFHIVRLHPSIRMIELRRSVEEDLYRIGFEYFDASKALLAYTSRWDPDWADPNKASFSPREASLIQEMYEWLIEQYENKPAPAAETREPMIREIIPVEAPKPAPLPAAAINPAPERTEGRRRRSSHGRNRTPEELEERTLARVRGQLAIDLLVMNEEAGMDAESDDDIEASERNQFVSACQACAELPDEYRDEQALNRMWELISPQDKALFTTGSLTDLIDSRFTIITCRCLLLALAHSEGAFDRSAILARAFELWEAFQQDSRPDSVRKLLDRNIYRYYMVGDGIPISVMNLLRSRAGDIRDAYNMYLEQILEEQKQQEIEFNAKLASQRKADQFHQQVTQRANIIGLIKKLTVLEDGAALGWLCMAVNGADFSKEKLQYYIENLMQRLETVGLKPVGTDKVARVFDGGSAGTEVFIDMSGHPLKAGVNYQMAQLGWMLDGELIVYPMAEQV